MNTDESYDAFINKLNYIINAEVQTKTIKILPLAHSKGIPG